MDEFDALDTLINTLATDTDGDRLLRLECRLRDYATFVGWTRTVREAGPLTVTAESRRLAALFLKSARHGV